jgi:HD superfamily phosphodiesterase
MDAMWKSLGADDKNVLLWAGLLHDIAKLGTPVIRGKDNIHPYTSAATALEAFARWGWLAHVDALPELVGIIRNAYTENAWGDK